MHTKKVITILGPSSSVYTLSLIGTRMVGCGTQITWSVQPGNV